MDARTLLISAGSVFLILIVLLAANIIDTTRSDQKIAAFTAQTNTIEDEMSEFSELLYEERSQGIAYLANTDTKKSDFEKVITASDKLFLTLVKHLEHKNYKKDSRFSGALKSFIASYDAHKLSRQKLTARNISSDKWFDSFNKVTEKAHLLRYTMFVPQTEVQSALFDNLVIKAAISELARNTSLEQAYLADIIAKEAEIGEDTKNSLVAIRSLSTQALKDLEFYTSQEDTDPSIQEAVKKMKASITKMQETQKRIYAAALLGFGFPVSLSDWGKLSQEVLGSIVKVEKAISGPTALRLSELESEANRSVNIMLISGAVSILVVIALAFSVHVKILSPLARQKVLRVEFENNVQSLVDMVQRQMQSMEKSSGQMREAGDKSMNEAGIVQEAMANTDSNVQAVASAIHELSSSIIEITSQMTQASDMINGATTDANNTQGLMVKLGDASERIGNAVSIINGIADQTNLLALNASIEAARAGDAGRGFAVVAEEVRKLAEETANATLKISEFVAEIQTESNNATEAIDSISGKIVRINEIANDVKTSITEQSSATESIAENATDASQATDTVKQSLGVMMGQLENSGHATTQLGENVGKASKAVTDLNGMSSDFLSELRKL